MIDVLFLCTHNSARSVLAEGLLNDLGRGRFRAFSAGSAPRANGEPNRFALRALEEAGIPTRGLRSKSWDEFAAPGAPRMHLVVTLCDSAAGETCPIWPGHPATAHWSFPDPSRAQGSEDEVLQTFRQTLDAIRHRIGKLVSLPEHLLAPAAIQSAARQLAAS